MSGFDPLSWLKLFGGQAEARAGSLTGDLSQRDKAAIARTLQSTSPGLTRNKAGSTGEQIQYLIDVLDNAVAPGDVANAAGSFAAMLKYLIANPAVQNGIGLGGWAGKTFPFDEGAGDVTIAGATDWTDAAGYRRVGKLTINANQVLSIKRSPFIIFAKEIAFGNASSQIKANGLDAALSTSQAGATALGGMAWVTATGPQGAVGGDGGGILIVIAGTISGSAGLITANGGAGNSNAVGDGNNAGGQAGQGAMSVVRGTAQDWRGGATTPGAPWALLMGDGGGSTNFGRAGGSASGYAGGSGIGGGGGGASIAGATPKVPPSIQQLLWLASMGCLGGGGGGATGSATGAANGGAGGGGGGVVVIVDTATATPTLQANGGAASNAGSGLAAAGAAGVTHYVVLN